MKKWAFSSNKSNVTVAETDLGQFELRRGGVTLFNSTHPKTLLQQAFFQGLLDEPKVKELAAVLGIEAPELGQQ